MQKTGQEAGIVIRIDTMGCLLPINVPAMSNAENKYQDLALIDFIYDAVISNPQTTQPGKASLQQLADMRVDCQLINGFNDAGAILFA